MHTQSQHENLREIYQELDGALVQEDAGALALWSDRLEVALRAHFELEQGVLFPLLLEIDPQVKGPLARLVAEHRDFLERIGDQRPGPSWASLAKQVAGLREHLSEHESLEERLMASALAETGSGSGSA